MPLPRRLRGALGTALTWSVAAAAPHLLVGPSPAACSPARRLRRLRGALGTALTWSVAAAALQRVVGLFALAFTTGGAPAVVVRGTAGWAGLGFVAGLAFAGAVLALARHRTLDRLS